VLQGVSSCIFLKLQLLVLPCTHYNKLYCILQYVIGRIIVGSLLSQQGALISPTCWRNVVEWDEWITKKDFTILVEEYCTRSRINPWRTIRPPCGFYNMDFCTVKPSGVCNVSPISLKLGKLLRLFLLTPQGCCFQYALLVVYKRENWLAHKFHSSYKFQTKRQTYY